jgi:shikimate 5-dehydrogenase
VVGAGGVGRAMAFGLKERGAAVTLTDVDESRASALALQVGVAAVPISAMERGGSPDLTRGTCDILLNCTPVGMHPKTDASPVPKEMLRRERVVYDAVYNPLETRLLREARAAGCRTVAGIDHFVRQAVEQFELWTGRPAPVETMRRVVIVALSE